MYEHSPKKNYDGNTFNLFVYCIGFSEKEKNILTFLLTFFVLAMQDM